MPDRPRSIRLACCLASLSAGLIGGGCTSLDLGDFRPFDSAPEYELPASVSDVWTEAVLHQPGLPGVRGFGGRIMFHAAESDRLVRPDGTLVIYAFDESNGDADPDKPERKFVFPADKLQDHYSESKLGHTYSVWLPWGEVGGPQQRIALLPRFEARSGEVIMGASSVHVLPGTVAESPAKRGLPKPAAAVRQASHEAAVEQPDTRPQITAATIPLPPSFARQVFADPNFQAPSRPTLELGGESWRGLSQFSHSENGTVPFRESLSTASQASAQVPYPTQAAQQPPGAGLPAQPYPQPPEAAPPTGSALPRFPARREPAVQPRSARVRTQPFPATWPSRLPMTPRSTGYGFSQTPPPSDSPATQPTAASGYY
jgi:hypothetical protein